jgi:hypothetical protein
MQTFLPYADFVQTARVLDRQRLGKQRLEAEDAIRVTLNVRAGLPEPRRRNHPTRLMWENNLHALCQYAIAICDEWIARGYQDIMRPRFVKYMEQFEDNGMPFWLGNEDFHLAHRSNLLRKGRERFEAKGKRDTLDHYRSLWSDTVDTLPYIWPVRIATTSNASNRRVKPSRFRINSPRVVASEVDSMDLSLVG